MTSESSKEKFQLITDDIPRENTKLTELIPPRLQLLLTGELQKSYGYEYCSSQSTMNTSAFASFRAFIFSIFSSLINSLIY